MKAYFKCICTTSHKLLAKQLKDQGYEIRLITKNPEWRRQAKEYGLKMPFIVDDQGVRPL